MTKENEVSTKDCKCAILVEAAQWLKLKDALSDVRYYFEKACDEILVSEYGDCEEDVRMVKDSFDEAKNKMVDIIFDCLAETLQHHIKENGMTLNND